jgi:transaldolase
VRIYIDSADMGEVRKALATGYVYGVTTNPTLLRRANVRVGAVAELAWQVIEWGAKELHLQTYSDDADAIVREGTELAALDAERVVVKIPAVPSGYAGASRLASQGIRVTMTAVYTLPQVVLADAAGAHYVAVYLGRMRDSGVDAPGLVGQMQRTLNIQNSKVEILAASVRSAEDVAALAELGVATATLPWKVLSSLTASDATATAASTFLDDARAIG